MQSDDLRQPSNGDRPRRVVIKVGTRLVTHQDGTVDHAFMRSLAEQVAELSAEGIQAIVVTSGAVNLGRRLMVGDSGRHLRSTERPAAAAAGQPLLMQAWAAAFAEVELGVAQVLLTQDDIVDRQRCIHLRETLGALQANQMIPLLNENDSVSGPETTFGENDNLAAMVAVALAPSDLLIFLQDEDGLLTADPRSDESAELIACVAPDEDLSQYAAGAGGPESLGGMSKKLEAARQATDCGIRVLIASGECEGVVTRLVAGEEVGTCLLARERIPSRKGWLSVHGRPAGTLVVDDGAKRALMQRDGNSLLAIGIVEATGDFAAGELVTIRDSAGREIARGLANYSRAETDLIRGQHSSRIPELLGHEGSDEVVHRDDMVLARE